MAKVNKSVMEQFIKGLSVDSEGNMEVTSSIARGMFHVIIKNEITDYIKANYNKPYVIMNEDIKSIANNLERHPAQVRYYVGILHNEEIIQYKNNSTNPTWRVYKKIEGYFLNRGENVHTSIYEIAKAIGENVTTIYAIIPNASERIEINPDSCGYDDRGRKARTIRLSSGSWAKAKKNR